MIGPALESRLFDLLGCDHLDLIAMLIESKREAAPAATASFSHASATPAADSPRAGAHLSATAGDRPPEPFKRRRGSGAVWSRNEELNLTEVPA